MKEKCSQEVKPRRKESHELLDICLGENSPQSLVDLFKSAQ